MYIQYINTNKYKIITNKYKINFVYLYIQNLYIYIYIYIYIYTYIYILKSLISTGLLDFG